MGNGTHLRRRACLILFLLAGSLSALTKGQLKAFQESLLKYVNQVRTDPQGFAETYIKYHYDNGIDNGLYKELMGMRPLPAYTMSEKLNSAAWYYAWYLGKNNKMGHEADGRTFWQRINAYGYAFSSAGENVGSPGICYSNPEEDPGLSAINSLIQWLIDDGVADLGHRRNILSPNYTQVGSGCWHEEGSEFQNYSVMEFARPK